MDEAARVRALLAVLQDANVSRARVTVGDISLDVEFAPEVQSGAVPAAAFVDRDGKPVDLDEGMPELARDPVELANFPAPPVAKRTAATDG